MSSKKLKSELLFSSTLSESPYSTKYNSNRESTMRGSLPRKAMLSYCILGILSAFSHSAIAHGPEKITPIENDKQFLTGVPDPNTRNANEEGVRAILNSNPSGVADGGLTGQRTNSPAPATAATSGENAAVLPTPPATAASPIAVAGSSKATSVTTTEPVAVTAHKESAAVPPTLPAAPDPSSVAANAGNLTLAAGSPSSTAAQQRHEAALSRGQNINQASNPEDMFTYDPQTGVMHVGENAVGTTISIAGRQGDRVITGLADGVRNNDAANVGQLNRVNNTATSAQALAQKNTARIKDIENKLSKTNTKIDRGLAASAALTGLFQPYGVGKINFTAGMGGYGSSQAIAVGSGYRISENTAFKAGVAYSGGSNVMYNASFNLEW